MKISTCLLRSEFKLKKEYIGSQAQKVEHNDCHFENGCYTPTPVVMNPNSYECMEICVTIMQDRHNMFQMFN